MDKFKSWLEDNNYDWQDPKLSLGYIKLGQIDLNKTFGNTNFLEIYNTMLDNLNINSIKTSIKCEYPYTLDSENWKKIQMDNLREGYESRNLR